VAQVVYSQAALDDFERIIEFMLRVDPPSAGSVLQRIRSAIEILSSHPLIGRRVQGELRELPVAHGRSGYLVLYRVDMALDVVRVLRIRHQREAGYRE
jgi:plasmid stabilization system protein ParE